MTSPTPGWYPDPHVELLMRWWDGSDWTDDTYERVEPIEVWHPSGTAPNAPGPVPGAASGGRPAGAPARPAGAAAPDLVVAAPSTDDGVPVAAWWPRAGARVLDWVVTGLLAWLVAFPQTKIVLDSIGSQLDAAVKASNAGEQVPAFSYDEQTIQALFIISLAWVLVSLLYNLGFLLWRSATPGKLVFGLMVRRWTAGQRLTVLVVLRRWLAFEGASVLSYLGTLYIVVDVLWPLRDRRRQALHDKVAGTCVVRVADQRLSLPDATPGTEPPA